MIKLNLQTTPTPEQELWLSQQIQKQKLIRVPNRVNPCLAMYGKGPDDKRCKTCVHLVSFACAKKYYKCDLRKITHGRATDHLVNWPACSQYQPR